MGSRTLFVNNATLAGHVEVGDDATIGAFSAVHQFCRVGRHAYVGGYTVVTMDALPFVKTVGYKATCYGLNVIGLRRKGIGRDAVRAARSGAPAAPPFGAQHLAGGRGDAPRSWPASPRSSTSSSSSPAPAAASSSGSPGTAPGAAPPTRATRTTATRSPTRDG